MSGQPDAEFDQWLRATLAPWRYLVELRVTPMNPTMTEPMPYTFVITGEATVEARDDSHVVRWAGPPAMKVEDEAV